MFRKWVLPVMLLLFTLISLTVLRSVAPSLLNRQLVFFLLGMGIFWITSRIPFPLLSRLAPPMYGGVLVMLVLTQLIGNITRGTRSWIPVGSFHIQPSQLAVIASGLVLCQLVMTQPVNTFKRFLQFWTIAGVPALLIFLEPDLGTAVIYMISMGSIFFLSQTKNRYFFITGAGVVALLVVAWLFLLKPHQKERITSYIDLSSENTQTQADSDAQYNAVQSLIAVGSGQVYGRGLGHGVQSHLRFLPERQTDFVFASFAEETGVLGSLLVIGMFSFLTCFVIFVGMVAATPAEQLFCFMTATMLSVQVGVNIGMNMGLFPITGITLPMISYGGSSILAFCFHYGCIQSIVNSYKKQVTMHIR